MHPQFLAPHAAPCVQGSAVRGSASTAAAWQASGLAAAAAELSSQQAAGVWAALGLATVQQQPPEPALAAVSTLLDGAGPSTQLPPMPLPPAWMGGLSPAFPAANPSPMQANVSLPLAQPALSPPREAEAEAASVPPHVLLLSPPQQLPPPIPLPLSPALEDASAAAGTGGALSVGGSPDEWWLLSLQQLAAPPLAPDANWGAFT